MYGMPVLHAMPLWREYPGCFRSLQQVYQRGQCAGFGANSRSIGKPPGAFPCGYDRSVPKLRQADHCIGCGQCVSHCPQSIDIPAQMQRIDGFVEHLKQGTL